MIRISAGSLKGKKLAPCPFSQVRPTLGQAKEAFFDIIGPEIQGMVFVDVYAGTGNMGIEALSRGAEKAVFVERDRQVSGMIRSNLESLKLTKQARLMTGDAMNVIPKLHHNSFLCDILYMDPPYLQDQITELLAICHTHPVVKEDGLIVLEHMTKKKIDTELLAFPVYKEKSYGNTTLTFFRIEDKPENTSSL